MTVLWALLALIVCLGAVRQWRRLRSYGASGAPRVDDDVVRQVLETGRVSTRESEPLDLKKIARAEEEFWSESWDEPEEYPR